MIEDKKADKKGEPDSVFGTPEKPTGFGFTKHHLNLSYLIGRSLGMGVMTQDMWLATVTHVLKRPACPVNEMTSKEAHAVITWFSHQQGLSTRDQ